MGIIILPVRNGGAIMELPKEEKKELMGLIGDNVRRCRNDRGLTQEELSRLVDVDTSTITRIEGGTRMMSIQLLRSMAAALRVSCDALLFADDSNRAMANIQVKLAGQTPESLAHLERVIQTLIEEYGNKEKTPPE